MQIKTETAPLSLCVSLGQLVEVLLTSGWCCSNQGVDDPCQGCLVFRFVPQGLNQTCDKKKPKGIEKSPREHKADVPEGETRVLHSEQKSDCNEVPDPSRKTLATPNPTAPDHLTT